MSIKQGFFIVFTTVLLMIFSYALGLSHSRGYFLPKVSASEMELVHTQDTMKRFAFRNEDLEGRNSFLEQENLELKAHLAALEKLLSELLSVLKTFT